MPHRGWWLVVGDPIISMFDIEPHTTTFRTGFEFHFPLAKRVGDGGGGWCRVSLQIIPLPRSGAPSPRNCRLSSSTGLGRRGAERGLPFTSMEDEKLHPDREMGADHREKSVLSGA